MSLGDLTGQNEWIFCKKIKVSLNKKTVIVTFEGNRKIFISYESRQLAEKIYNLEIIECKLGLKYSILDIKKREWTETRSELEIYQRKAIDYLILLEKETYKNV